jgi:hypothetical protein
VPPSVPTVKGQQTDGLGRNDSDQLEKRYLPEQTMPATLQDTIDTSNSMSSLAITSTIGKLSSSEKQGIEDTNAEKSRGAEESHDSPPPPLPADDIKNNSPDAMSGSRKDARAEKGRRPLPSSPRHRHEERANPSPSGS